MDGEVDDVDWLPQQAYTAGGRGATGSETGPLVTLQLFGGTPYE